MTREEATWYIYDIITDSVYGITRTEKEACEMAIKALEQPERAHAHWTCERTYAHDGELYCSHCDCDAPAEYGRYTYMKTDFCPNCGAKMDGGDSDAVD